MNTQAVSDTVQRWLDTFVVGMNLCPFAAQPIVQDRVRLVVSDARDEITLLEFLQEELLSLARDPSTETTLLIHPLVLENFSDYNDFLTVCDTLLKDMNAEGEFQIASFHPQYQFAQTHIDDAENYTNRSPYPLLHILRESSITYAVETHPNVDNIPQNNIETLCELDKEYLQAEWLKIREK